MNTPSNTPEHELHPSEFDLFIIESVKSLKNAGNKEFTAAQLVKHMHGNSSGGISDEEIQYVEDRIKVMITWFIRIEVTEEFSHYPNLPKEIKNLKAIQGHLLDTVILERKDKDGKTRISFGFPINGCFGIPDDKNVAVILETYSESIKQLTCFPTALLNIPKIKSSRAIRILTNYLVKTIQGLKKNKKGIDKILFDTIEEDLYMDNFPAKRKTLMRKCMVTIVQSCKEKGQIKDYEILTEGAKYKGVRIEWESEAKKKKMVEMNFEEAIRYIHENPQIYLTETGKKGGGYICPICGSGSGSHRTGIMPDKNESWKFTCFANGCFPPKSDVINIIGAKENLDNKQAMFRAFEIYGITLKKNSDYVSERPKSDAQSAAENEISRIKADVKNAPENLWQAEEYLRSRGISLRTAVKLNCGFISEWYHPKVLEKFNGKPPFEGSPRLIIPSSEESYLARDIRPLEEISEEERSYIKQKAGNAKILNLKAVATAESPIFVVEGEFDLMSVEELGYTAIALGSTSMIEHLVTELQENHIKVTQPFVIALDNDAAGQTAAEKLLTLLQDANYKAYIVNISGKYKDANEALVNDKNFFAKRLSEVAADPKTESLKNERNEESNMGKIENLLSIMRTSRKPLSTGFEKLDENLDGGLYAPGLYIIAGGTSVGKTALMQQIAYNLAVNKQDIIYFSLEMSIQDLFYRDLSRLSRQFGKGQSVHEIIQSGGQYITEKIVAEYKKAASHIFTHAALSEITVEYIEKTATNHVKRLEKKPVLFVDYLQILEPTNPRGTDKQIVDHSIKSLNILSRSLEIPIVVAASLNRSGYSEEVTFQALKESGALEYTGDIVIGLQFQATSKITEKSKNLAERTKKLTAERNKSIRKMEAVILKHRNGKIGGKTYFDYIPKYNLYKEGLPDKNSSDSLQSEFFQDSNTNEENEPPVIRKRILK